MPTVTVPQAFELALQHHRAGRFAEAEVLYRQILAMQPNHADALHHLGVVALQAGRPDLAVEWIQQTLLLNPGNPAAHSNLGEGYRRLGRLDEAIAACRRALQLKPDQPEAENNLGNALKERGRFEEAIAAFHRALEFQPDHAITHYNLGIALAGSGQVDDAVAAYRRAVQFHLDYPEAHNNLGAALTRQGRFDEASAAYRRALELKPDYAEAHNNLGIALAGQGQLEEAIAAHRRALQYKPDHPEAQSNLGNALRDFGLLDEAIAAYQRALELKPDDPVVYNHLGIALADNDQFRGAVAAYRRALELKPDYAKAHNNLGTALVEIGQFDEAIAAYRRALELSPEHADASSNLGMALAKCGEVDETIAAYRRAVELKPGRAEIHNNLGTALKDQGQLDEAIAALRYALELQPDHARVHSNLVYALHFHPDQNDKTIAGEHRRWDRQFSEPLRQFILPHANDPDPLRRIKIGYVSPDFRCHSVSFFLAPLLEGHDHRLFEIYCYANVRRPDATTQRLRKSADVWREVRSFTDTQLAECVRDDGIDILVDLALHTADNRLVAFARKPAPIQVSWLGYPGSTGMEAIDYRLTDAYIDPADQENTGGGEHATRLPDSWCCYAPIAEFPPVGPLPAAAKNVVTFGSLNQFCKINERLLRCWARLLAAVPKSRLQMVCPKGRAQECTRGLFAAHGIAPERVELAAPCRWPDYIRRFEEIDLALDTYPCNGMTTTCHSLWMGVPTVTLAGNSAVSRAGSSLLHTVGLPEWVAQSEEEYVRIATEWANDLPRLAELRGTLRSQMEASPLMDAPRFARNVETAYRTMWRQWCAENSPHHVDHLAE